MEPDAVTFRRLCRTSPWRFSSLRFALDRPGLSEVTVWLRRPGDLRVQDASGAVLTLNAQGRTDYLTGNRKPWLLPPALVRPVYDDAGLVLRRPEAAYGDPGFGETPAAAQRFSAWLDPVQLAGSAPPTMEYMLDQVVHVEAVQQVTHAGRPAWQALAIPGHRYEPAPGQNSGGQDSVSQDSAGQDSEWDAAILAPTANLIRIDVGTGVCVAARRLGAAEAADVAAGTATTETPSAPDDSAEWEHSISILGVDDYMLDDLFAANNSDLSDVAGSIEWKVLGTA